MQSGEASSPLRLDVNKVGICPESKEIHPLFPFRRRFQHRAQPLLPPPPSPSAATPPRATRSPGPTRRYLAVRPRHRCCVLVQRLQPFRGRHRRRLHRAPDPAVLVLRAVSRCYFCAESENAETACVLLVELYVRAGCPHRPEEEAELRAEAGVGALSWRSRIVWEKGRVTDASPMDARGVILLMDGFCVPVEFPLQEFYELLLAGGSLTCVEVLTCSQLVMKKLRDVVADMLNRGSYREAIGVILPFELQEAFPLTDILTYIVDKVVCNMKKQEIEVECDLVGLVCFAVFSCNQFIGTEKRVS